MYGWLVIWWKILDLIRAVLSKLGVPVEGAPQAPEPPRSERVKEFNRKAGRQYPAEKQDPHGPRPR